MPFIDHSDDYEDDCEGHVRVRDVELGSSPVELPVKLGDVEELGSGLV